MRKANEPTIAALLEGGKGRIQRTTPVGIAVYPHILAADEYQLKTNNKHECNTGLRLDGSSPAVTAFIAELDAMAKEAFEVGKVHLQERIDSGELKAKKLADARENLAKLTCYVPYEPDYDDDGNETGDYMLRAKTQVSGIDSKTNQRWHREVPVFDSRGQKIEGEARANLKLWGGSRIAVAVQVVPFCAEGLQKAGISLRMGAVQVIQLSGGSSSADSFGFGVEGDGYVAETFESTAGGYVAPAAAESDPVEDDEDF